MLPVAIPSLIALLGGFVGYFLKFYLDKKAQFSSKNADIKREAYAKFIDLTVNFFITSKKAQKQQHNIVDDLSYFYKQYVLYGSPKVVKAFAEFMQIFYLREIAGLKDKELTRAELRHMMRGITKTYAAMRKDIGLSNRFLGRKSSVLMRGIIKDYDVIMVPRPILWWRLFRVNMRAGVNRSRSIEQAKAPQPIEESSSSEQKDHQEATTQNRQQRRSKRRGK